MLDDTQLLSMHRLLLVFTQRERETYRWQPSISVPGVPHEDSLGLLSTKDVHTLLK